MKKRKVIIVGGGVAGLSAAHELIERDFDVTVFERNYVLGGKARSVAVPSAASNGNEPLPGEHGFRFFPGWYKHLPDTMSRIPYPKTGGTVADNLVPAEVNLLASYEGPPIRAVVRFPRTWAALKLVFKFPKEVVDLIPAEDLEFFMRKMSQFLASCEERRRQEFETQSWWEFMEADSRSKPFRDYLVRGATRNSIAAKATVASAYTVAKVAVQTFLDLLVPGGNADRVLDGPTNEVWIDPWRSFLEEQGVAFEMGWELDGVQWSVDRATGNGRSRGELEAVVLTRTRDTLKEIEAQWETLSLLRDTRSEGLASLSRREKVQFADRCDYVSDLQLSRLWRDELVNLAALLRKVSLERSSKTSVSSRGGEKSNAEKLPTMLEQVTQLARELEEKFVKGFQALALGARPPGGDAAKYEQCVSVIKDMPAKESTDYLFRWLSDRRDELRQLQREPLRATADYFIFALPVEQMAYYINREPTLVHYDESLENVVRLSEYVDWMSGIQFYFRERLDITRGHIDCLDSEWSLTAISQTQFWDHVDLKERADGTCKSILSVDISSWDTLGGLVKKPAWDCTPSEIADEVWDQLKRSLNRPGQSDVLAERKLVGGSLAINRSFFLDDSIVGRYDRKKQGLFEKFRRVAFDSGQLLERQAEYQRAADAPEAYGSRMEVNVEPLLVSGPRSNALRPQAKTGIPNMFLAADYVSTFTNLPSMESANEAARQAVNEILKASGARRAPCAIWPPVEPLETIRSLDKELFDRGRRLDIYADVPVGLAASAAKMAVGTAERAKAFFKRLT